MNHMITPKLFYELKLSQVDNYFGVPFKGKGETILNDPDLKSKMLYGEITNFGKSSNSNSLQNILNKKLIV